uniref:Large ribosomal subunit protein uL22c n=1 Tax=Calandrinia granulifera TaxID=2004975 RepID=A0A411JPF6_9CARY|nr:ribosomal protein L22 [Calandrinia granulifera]QBC66970.1 ribosomal protein L22 [Calandrinia granulifera]
MLNNLRKRDRYELYYISQMDKISQNGAYALGQYIPMSVDKARRVIDQIRGRSYEDSLIMLELMPYRACSPILKLIYSAAANASHNKGLNKANLLITKAEVSKGTTMKKLKPRARGRSYMIKRPTCHITIVLRDMSYMKKFNLNLLVVPLKYRKLLMPIVGAPYKYGYFVLALLVGDLMELGPWGEEELR